MLDVWAHALSELPLIRLRYLICWRSRGSYRIAEAPQAQADGLPAEGGQLAVSIVCITNSASEGELAGKLKQRMGGRRAQTKGGKGK